MDDKPVRFQKIIRLETRDLTTALDAIAKLGWTADNEKTPAMAPRGTIGFFRRGQAIAALVQRGASFSLLDVPREAAA